MKIKLVSKKDYKELGILKEEFELSDKGEICLAVGGDGTFLKAARDFEGPILPIRASEEGTLGYFSDVSLKDMDFVIERLKRKEYVAEPFSRKIDIMYKGRHFYAVNEVSLNNISKAVHFKIFRTSDGEKKPLFPYVIAGDGVLVTNNAGSTAYNKSAGGPIILSPSVTCVTLLAADTPIKNSIVMDGKDEFDIELIKGRGIVRRDSEDIVMLDSGEDFHVRSSGKTLDIVRFPDKKESFAEKLERSIKIRMLEDI